MNTYELATKFLTLSEEGQESFKKTLQEMCTEEQYRAFLGIVFYYRLHNDPRFYNAVQTAVGEAVYEELRKN